MILLNAYIIIGVLAISNSQCQYLPNLPMGEYRVLFDALYPCESTKDHLIACNLYLSKKSLNQTEFKGNLTLKMPLDNVTNVDLNFASWSLRGGWKDNSIVFIADNTCENIKMIFGKFWYTSIKAFGIPTEVCPLPMGTYVTSGFDVRTFDDHNFPKVYFYGKYKVTLKILNKEKKILGCITGEVRLVRPWEVFKA